MNNKLSIATLGFLLSIAGCGTQPIQTLGGAVSANCRDDQGVKKESHCIDQTLITAKQAAKAMGKGFNVGQMFDNNQHPATLERASPKIDAYYERGFRHVRIPVTWTEDNRGNPMADPNTGIVDRTHVKLKSLTEVIDYALAKPNMYVVINTHHEKALKDGNKAKVLEQLWADISDLYQDRSHRLIFEILNEPHLSDREPMPPENLRYMTALAYEKIRTDDPARLIAIGGNQWFAANEMAVTWPNLDQVGGGKDNYLMATFHHYTPWTFHGNDQGDYADNWTEADISDPMDTMLDWANTVGNGMPIFIGEWGTGWQSYLKTMNCNNIRLWYSQFDSEYASIKGMPTTVWDDGGWFGIFDHSSNSFGNNLIDCIDGKCEWDGEERFNAGCR